MSKYIPGLYGSVCYGNDLKVHVCVYLFNYFVFSALVQYLTLYLSVDKHLAYLQSERFFTSHYSRATTL